MTQRLFNVILCAVIGAGSLLAQGKSSLESEKARVAILTFDAASVVEKGGYRETWKHQGGTWEHKSDAPPLFDNEGALRSFADAATQKMVNAFVKLKRFTVIERTAMEAIMKEQDFQLTDFTNTNTAVQLGNMLGAQYLVQGQLQNVTAFPKYDQKKPDKLLGYSSEVEMQIRIIDVSTGEITASKDVKGNTSGEGLLAWVDMMEDNPNKAAYKALNEAEKKMYDWLKIAFPVEGEIFEILKTKKKEGAAVVSITCGKDLGVRKDDVFKVYTEKEVTVGTKTVKKTTDVGKLVVKKVEEDGVFSTCDVEKGGKDIADQIAAGVKLKVVQVKK
jgi:hypothetical protein